MSCKICFEQLANVVFQDCGHQMACSWCAEQLIGVPQMNVAGFLVRPRCPVCRAEISGVVRALPV
ncbi:hypothetical protein BDY21DRAFT_337386 [Lineolata rhizophorae]|uniref:RING-type domain-containing protein n=1 Tax=Lineolata rhizophorae TaxID=578093 RepID=A0A6A6P7V2_9PEZI|nr:hypothetical protein BDY21DRAFT_337386 [Lineolata rhizophorae]